MPNYISLLQSERNAARRQIANADGAILDFLTHLASDKFKGPCENWISTNDVESYLRNIREELLGLKTVEA